MGFWRDLFKTKKQRLDEYKEQLTSYKTIQIIRNSEKLKEKENAIPLIKANNELQNTLNDRIIRPSGANPRRTCMQPSLDSDRGGCDWERGYDSR